MARPQIEYDASPTAGRFHLDDSFVRGLIGPVGSGKSVACCWELMARATRQTQHNGVRRSRWAIIRNTYRELQDTTLKTWRDWFDWEKGVGTWVAGDMTHVIKVGDLEAEFMFRALDRPDDIKKLLSLELTGAWINEAREVPRQVLDMLQSRVGRYPSKRDGGPDWSGVIMDTNPPDTDHWWYRMFEEEQPEGWSCYHQPSGLSKEAENIDNLPANYYDRLRQGHDQAWIDVYVHGKYGFVRDGKPVFPEYNDHAHALERPPEVIRHRNGTRTPIYVGVDFGLTPAAVIAQLTPAGQYQVIDELVTEDMGAVRFGEMLSAKLGSQYPFAELKVWGDPAGEQRAQTDEKTPLQILRKARIPIVKAPTNDVVLRLEAVRKTLTSLTMTGVPRLVISPKAASLRKALAGGYKYRRLAVGGGERYADVPDKNQYSHVADALQYLLVGAGEAVKLTSSFVEKPRVNRTIKPRRSAYG